MSRWVRSFGETASAVRRQGSCLPRALALAWRAAPGLTAAWGSLLVIQGLLPAATLHLVRWLVDDLAALLGSGGGWRTALPLLPAAALLGGLMLLADVTRSAASWIHMAHAAHLGDHMSDLVHERSAAVDLGFYDTPEFFDRLHRARDESAYRPAALLEAAGGILESAITLAAMAAVLIPYGAALPVLLAASTLPSLLVVLRHGLRQHRWRIESTAAERRSWYFDWLLTGREAAAELRLFGLGDRFRSSHRTIRSGLRRERIRLARERGAAEAAAAGAGILVAAGAMGWMILRAIQGLASLGDLALFHQAFSHGQRRMRSLVEEMGRLYANSLFLSGLFEFLDLRSVIERPPASSEKPPAALDEPPAEGDDLHSAREGSRSASEALGSPAVLHLPVPCNRSTSVVCAAPELPAALVVKPTPGQDTRKEPRHSGEQRRRPSASPRPLMGGIRFSDVSFSYPGSRRAALKGFSLFVPAGRVVAILGENGAGKTTLTKLLCRLHDVDAGRIEIDGVHLRDMPLEDLRGCISVLFQRPVRYSDTAAGNVVVSDARAAGAGGPPDAAIRRAGAEGLIRRLPAGASTLLGKTFDDGVEISEGEWQRIALARTLYREAPILVLDEPTSSMDPWSEMEWIDRLSDSVRGRTALLITHRPTTAAAADEIHVMESGRIVESGSHEDLLARGGRYAQLWRASPGASQPVKPREPAAAEAKVC